MRKLIYSGFVKFVIFMLLIACSLCFIYKFTKLQTNTDSQYYNTADEDFFHSIYMLEKRNETLDVLFAIAEDMTKGRDYSKRISNLNDNQVKYSVCVNDGETSMVCSNYSAEPTDYDYDSGNFYYIKDFDNSISHNPYYNYYNYDVDIFDFYFDEGYGDGPYETDSQLWAVYMMFDMNAFSKEEALWENNKYFFNRSMLIVTASFIGMIICEILLIFLTGENGSDKKIHKHRIDSFFGEIMLIIAGAVFFMGGLGILSVINYKDGWVSAFWLIIVAVTVFTATVDTAILLSFVRSIKNNDFFERFCLIKILLSSKSAVKGICQLNTGRWLIAILLAYTVAVAFFAKFDEIGFMIIICLFIFVCIKSADFVNEFDTLRTGIAEIKKGNTAFKISDCKYAILRETAENINDIGKGFEKAFDEKIKSERLKSELITNVSHDLKTPLTSIINYSQLLCSQELQPNEANDYAKIIYDKSSKLKSITSDLFDISKVQSGNDTAEKEALDICLLINQALGELDGSIKSSDLEFIKSFESEQIFINADGKKMSRVFENLIINCLKYSLDGTRVYISVKRDGKKVVTQIKNIASYKIDFDSDEITERFVRGDVSRSTDGNGLGLAIVKSYVNVCGGKFNIITDGDLFKAEIIFDELTGFAQ